jgi:hypothetical protein
VSTTLLNVGSLYSLAYPRGKWNTGLWNTPRIGTLYLICQADDQNQCLIYEQAPDGECMVWLWHIAEPVSCGSQISTSVALASRQFKYGMK